MIHGEVAAFSEDRRAVGWAVRLDEPSVWVSRPAPSRSCRPTELSGRPARGSGRRREQGVSPWGHNSDATMPCIHVVPDFGAVVMKMSSGRGVNRSHRWLSS